METNGNTAIRIDAVVTSGGYKGAQECTYRHIATNPTGKRTMSHRIATAIVVLSLSASVMAQETTTTASRPLNLSLPHDVQWSSTVRQGPALDGAGSGAIGLPDIGARSATGRSGRMPYGTGYEARQRNSDSGASSNGAGTGRGHGGGGRMGRGR